MTNKITSHTIVVNEEQWIWYAINSVLPFVDYMFITDLGSTDKTVDIIRSIKSPKIIFEQLTQYDHRKSVEVRQNLLDRTKTDWFFVLDGDEIWPKNSIQKVTDTIKASDKNLWGIVTPTINFLGDVFHVEEDSAGRYEFLGKKGHLALRAMRRLPGMKMSGNYPLEGYLTEEGKPIQNYDEKLVFSDAPYCHMTNLRRSSSMEKDKTVFKRQLKKEIGPKVSKDFVYPEVFYLPHPQIVPGPFLKMSKSDYLIGAALTPFKRIKRRIV
jgi:glycosyltransferase involved in cell wall biosynthesis